MCVYTSNFRVTINKGYGNLKVTKSLRKNVRNSYEEKKCKAKLGKGKLMFIT